jgi:hypothetical protein
VGEGNGCGWEWVMVEINENVRGEREWVVEEGNGR